MYCIAVKMNFFLKCFRKTCFQNKRYLELFSFNRTLNDQN